MPKTNMTRVSLNEFVEAYDDFSTVQLAIMKEYADEPVEHNDEQEDFVLELEYYYEQSNSPVMVVMNVRPYGYEGKFFRLRYNGSSSFAMWWVSNVDEDDEDEDDEDEDEDDEDEDEDEDE